MESELLLYFVRIPAQGLRAMERILYFKFILLPTNKLGE
jgi:hypothetical protein